MYIFEFDGVNLGLFGFGEGCWFFLNGYVFVIWFYVEVFVDVVSIVVVVVVIVVVVLFKFNKMLVMLVVVVVSVLVGEGIVYMLRFFSFLFLDSLGVEVYFYGKYLVVDCVIGKGKKFLVYFIFLF